MIPPSDSRRTPPDPHGPHGGCSCVSTSPAGSLALHAAHLHICSVRWSDFRIQLCYGAAQIPVCIVRFPSNAPVTSFRESPSWRATHLLNIGMSANFSPLYAAAGYLAAGKVLGNFASQRSRILRICRLHSAPKVVNASPEIYFVSDNLHSITWRLHRIRGAEFSSKLDQPFFDSVVRK